MALEITSDRMLTDKFGAWVCADESIIRRTAQSPTLTVGVKDVIVTADFPTRFGTQLPEHAFDELLAMGDAQIVTQLKQAGSLIAGKTVSTELATFQPGLTKNPWRSDLTPGGSSSGSAVAVATGDVDVAIATQTAGSTGRPAAYCGVFGYKPTFGLLSTAGVLCTSPTLDTVGLMSRDIDTLKRVLAVCCGIESPETTPVHDFTLVVHHTLWWDQIEPTMRAAIEDLTHALTSMFGDSQHRDLVVDLIAATDVQRTLHSAEVAQELGHLASHYPDQLSPLFRRFVAEGELVSTKTLKHARDYVAQLRDNGKNPVSAGEIWITPVAFGIAPHRDLGTGDPLFCRAWTAAGNPTLTVPIGESAGAPMGVQLVAAPGADATLLSVASAIMPFLKFPWERPE